ncbi:hypothetical protein HY449_04795 [Candidatus Pacearchaeota archaeon]|nr:hypothetical protein [Candidatus Pacearchaeota archaeon]
MQTLKQKLYETKNRLGLVGGTIEINEYDETENPFSARISPRGWNVEMILRKGYNPVSDKRQKAYARAKKISDGLETLLTDALKHEIAHWELPSGSGMGCPYDLHYHDLILEGIESGLPDDKKSLAGYVANAFEDLIINPRCKEFDGSFSGQVLFWDNEGILCREKGRKTFTPFYEAFVKLNMHLFGDKTDKALLKRHYSNDSKVDKSVKQVVRNLSLQEAISPTSPLFDKSAWPNMAHEFAKAVAPLLENNQNERPSAFSGEQGNGGQNQGNEQKHPAGNGIEQKIGTREGAEEVAYGRYASGDEHSPHFTSHEQLDALYQRLARSIPVAVESKTKKQSLTIAPLNFKPFDEDRDDIARAKLSKIYLDDGEITFGVQRHPLTVTANMKSQRKSFPDFKLVMLDNSGSMRQAPDLSNNVGRTNFIPWGENSKYHYALLGLYGIEQFLQNQEIAQYIQHGVSLFSSATRYKESDFRGLAEVRKHALSPDWGNTRLDASSLTNALQGRESFVLSISDGGIENWNSEKTAFKKSLENSSYAHIQIGDRTDFTNELEAWGVPVFYVNSGEELSRLMVDVTKQSYRRYVKDGNKKS